MDGLLLKLVPGQIARPEPRFWRLFSAVRQNLDRLAWCLRWQPWMGAPQGFESDSVEIPFQDPEASVFLDVHLWRPGSLSKYADHFCEEQIELWGLEPTRDNPQQLVTTFCKLPFKKQDQFVQEYAQVWLLYTDSSCWEIYARKPHLLDTVRQALSGLRWVTVYESSSSQRIAAFRAAGLSRVWEALHGDES